MFHNIPLQELFTKFQSDQENGLTSTQALENKQKFGANIFEKSPPPTLTKQLLEALKEPMVLLLIFAALLALGINTYEYLYHNQSNFLECIGIFIAIFISVAITLIMENKSQKAFETLNAITQGNTIKTLRDGEVKLIPQEEIVNGDILLLETGNKIPCDCRIIHSQSLMCNESSLTGESMPSIKNPILSNHIPNNTYENMLYSGCFITQGNAKAICVAVGNHTEFGKIAKALDQTIQTTTPLQEKLQKLSGRITIFGASAAFLAFLIQVVFFVLRDTISFENITQAFISSVVLIVASVPEGLPTIVAISLALNIIKMSKQNALIKKLIACETIGCVNIICSDKTGTLTQNQMSVEHSFIQDRIFEFHSHSLQNLQTSPIKDSAFFMLHNAALNSTADISQKGEKYDFIGNPTECALLVFGEKIGFRYKEIRKNFKILHSFPFSSQTKNMTSLVEFKGKVLCLSKGSPEKILSQCKMMPCQDTLKINKQILYFQNLAYRVIAFAHKEIADDGDFKNRELLESEMIFDGFVAISDPLRPEVYEAIMDCKKAGIDVKILTGDNLSTAKAIGNQLHLLDHNSIAIEASELENLNQKELLQILPKIKIIARSTPDTKMQIVNILKSQGNVVALSGDGINDAPALKNADVGIAMGISGTEVSKAASDIILLNDSFATIVKAIEWGRGIYQNFQRFIQFQLTVNLSSVIIVLFAVIAGLTAPFSALQLLWVNLIMDGPPALTLGLEPISKNLLAQKPIKRNANIITKDMLILIIINGVFIAFVCLLQYFTNFLGATPKEKSSVLFTLFVIFQLFNAFNARELHNQSIFKNLTNNRLMLGVFILTFALQVLIVEFGGEAFKTTPLDLIMWIKILFVGFSVIIVGEIVRFLLKISRKNNLS